MQHTIAKYVTQLRSLGRSEKTISAYERRLLRFRRYTGVQDLDEITPVALRTYQDQLLAQNLRQSSRFAFLASLRRFLAWIHEEGLTLTDLSQHVELPRRPNQFAVQPLTESEVQDLLESVQPDTYVHRRRRAILELMYGAGLRREEICRLRISDVDQVRRSIFVRGKGGKERVVPVGETALHYLGLYLAKRIGPKGKGPLFTSIYGKALYPGIIGAMFRAINKKHSKHVHAHLLRHCYAVHMLRGGADIRVVQELLGHESIDTTQQYLHLVKEDLKSVYDAAMEGVFG